MISRHFALGLLMALGIGGYPMLAALLSLANAGDSRLPSILLRLGVALLALFALWLNRQSLRAYHPVFLICFTVFWTLYIFRVISDAYVAQIAMPFQPAETLAMLATFVLIPALPALAGLNPWSSKWGFRLLSGVTVFTLLVLMLQVGDIASMLQSAGATRFRLERLNPISVGYVGATMLVLGAVGVFRPSRSVGITTRAFFAAAGAMGLFTVVIAASRGPAIAAAVALLLYAFVPFRAGRATMGIICIAGMAVAVRMVRSLVYRLFEFDIFTRFRDAVEGYDNSAESRETSFAGAWQQFIDNPFLGDSLVEKTTGSYPHNLVLEALMATGVVGGLAYIALMVLLVVAAIRLLNREEGYEWIALLGIVFGVSGMFSGAHFTSDIQWLSLTAVVVTEMKLRPGAAARQMQRRHRAAAATAAADTVVAPRNRIEKSLMKGEQSA